MTFIVAEIGVNRAGDFELVKDMMSNAKVATTFRKDKKIVINIGQRFCL